MADLHPTYSLGPDFDSKLESFTNAFLAAGWEVFASEFGHLDSFIEGTQADSSDRDDHHLRRTEKPLYLLEAVACKIYDTLNIEQFNRTTETLIVLPDCLTLHNPYCEKSDSRRGDECQGCTPECLAHRVTTIAERYGAKVLFSKRKLEEQLEYHKGKSKNLGVIGIGCILMLAHGMRKAVDLEIPVRGIPLNYCGCDHWTDEQVATSFPLNRLEQMLKDKRDVSNSTTHG